MAVFNDGVARIQRRAAQLLEKQVRILCLDIPLIEALGGGNARCMMAEIHLPARG